MQENFRDMCDEATHKKIAAHQEKMAIIEASKARERDLQAKIDTLISQGETYKEQMRMKQEMTNRILVTRIELDAELGQLKKKYASDMKEWKNKLKTEQEVHSRDMARAAALVEELKAEAAALAEKHNQHLVKARDQLVGLHQQMTEVEDELSQKLKAAKYDHEQDLFKLQAEHEKVCAAQKMTGHMLQKRVESDGELSSLQRKYQSDSKVWKKKMQQEIAIRDKQAAEFKAEIKNMKKEIAEMESQRNDLRSLFQLSMKVMFGMDSD
jgi:hypothetical protein